MSRLKLVNANDLEKYLFHLGFSKERTKGSHSFYKHSDGRYTTIPFHNSKDLARPLLRSILNQIKIEVEEFNTYFL